MHETRSLKELFDIVKKHHAYFSETGTVSFMCTAATIAFQKGDITSHEKDLVKSACMDLVRNYDDVCMSLEAALMEAGLVHSDTSRDRVKALVVNFWNKYIKSLEE